jgi:hypothetical protein
MAKTATVKKVKLKPFQKLLTVMISGNVVTREEIDTLLGKEIQMYRISTYMWHIKTNPSANGAIKVVKDGRKVVGYQLINIAEMKEYMKRVGILNTSTQNPVQKLEDLKAEELPKVEKMVVTEITEA